MQPRRKPIPTPIVRPSDLGHGPRALVPSRTRSLLGTLPTVAALLAMAAVGCERQAVSIERDEPTFTLAQTIRTTGHLSSDVDGQVKSPRIHDPSEPLPSLGMIEEAPPPPPDPSAKPVPPTPHTYPVKGAMTSVHPLPSTPPMPGGISMVKPPPPPIAPKSKPVKLGGDVAPAFPETT